MFSFVKYFMLLFSLLLTINSSPAFAQEPGSRQEQLTSANPQISLDTLDIMMAPLIVEELKTEADGSAEQNHVNHGADQMGLEQTD